MGGKEKRNSKYYNKNVACIIQTNNKKNDKSNDKVNSGQEKLIGMSAALIIINFLWGQSDVLCLWIHKGVAELKRDQFSKQLVQVYQRQTITSTSEEMGVT